MAKEKILALSLGLALLLFPPSLFPFAQNDPVSASPDRLKWSVVDTPSEEGNVVISLSEINAFVLGSDDETFYAIDIPNGKVYKSINGGVTWDDRLTEALGDAEPAATLPAWDIAVAPDNPELVAVVTNSRQEVYISGDGGDTWTNTGVSHATYWDNTLLISKVAISPEYDDTHDIAIGTRNPDGSTNGDVWVLESTPFANWERVGLNMDVSSVVFSPDYGADGVILAIASDTIGTYLRTRHKVGEEWRDVISPVEIKETANSPKESEIIVSDVALKSAGYAKSAAWIVYAAYYSTTEADDAYRIKHDEGEADALVTRLDIDRGGKVSIASIDYGGGKLLAGEVLGEKNSANALIHLCSKPEEYFPEWEEPTKPPTGGAISGSANAQVAWSSDGKTAYCATSTNYVKNAIDWANMTFGPWRGEGYDESALSVSKDIDTWNQLSLIDTDMAKLSDYALSSDYETLYLASVGNNFDSLWRSESETLGETWQRILCLDSETDKIILRPTPEESDKEAIFFAILDTHDARYSLDEGKTWKRVWDCPEITDLAVVSNKMFYILDDGLVNKCWQNERYGGLWEWERDIDTRLLSPYVIAVSGEDYVFVAEDENGEGKLAYSDDGGATFELTEAVPEPGNMQVIPDEEFDINKFIYAASSEGKIYRWTIRRSTSWQKLNPRYEGFCGLTQIGGALYGAYADRQGVARTLIPHLQTVTEFDWDWLKLDLPNRVRFKPGSLRGMSDETIDLWAIDDNDYDFEANIGCLWLYSDAFVLQTPWPTSPAIGGLLPCDPCTCQARTFCFCWKEIPLAGKYEIWIGLDEKFNAIIAKIEDIAPSDLQSPAWCPPKSLRFTCGETFYWKVRSSESTEGEAVHSRWSPPMYFTVKPCTSVGNVHIAPILEAPEPGSSDVSRSPSFSWSGFADTTKYELILAKDPNLAQIIIKEEVPTTAYYYSGKLDWGTTYFWQVRAIEPVPSEPTIGTFTVMPESKPPTPTPSPPPAVPFWIWLVIGILALLIVVIIVLCLVRR